MLIISTPISALLERNFPDVVRKHSCQYLPSIRRYKLQALCDVSKLQCELFSAENESSVCFYSFTNK